MNRKKFNVSEARQHLPALVDDVAESGEEILITRRGQPLARLVPFRPADAGQGIASLRGLPIEVSDDFDDPLPEICPSVPLSSSPWSRRT